MSKDILKSMAAQYNRVAGLLDKFIEICPDDVWAAPKGKFPIWQHVYHCYTAAGFFLGGKENQPPAALFPQEVASFKEIPPSPGGKAAIAKFAKEANAFVQAYFDKLTDADLPKPNEDLSARIGAPFDHTGTITLLIGHMYYHFGHCDAALRDNGLQGLL